jgi:hypothetical protein
VGPLKVGGGEVKLVTSDPVKTSVDIGHSISLVNRINEARGSASGKSEELEHVGVEE